MILLAIIGGILTILSMVINSALGRRIGVMKGTFVNFLGGIICSSLVLLVLGSEKNITIVEISKMPTYIFLGGALGVVVVISSNKIIPKIPVVYSTLLFFIGQIVAGIIIDYFLIGEVSTKKLIGAAIITLGILYNARIDKISEEEKQIEKIVV